MIRSMTAYASVEAERIGWSLRWELRSVNHRFLDIALKLPDPFRFIEIDARARIGNRFRRGRVEGSLSCVPNTTSGTHTQLNEAVARALLQTAADLERLAQRPLAPLNPLDLLRWPGVLNEVEIDREQIGAHALALLDEALDQALAVRSSEGGVLAALMNDRLVTILQHVQYIRGREPLIRTALRQKLDAKLAEITASPNQERLEQELVYWAQRLDITEELDRIGAHIGEFQNVLASPESIGRRLDFLLQELNREANTLGSKSTDAASTAAAVEIKVLLEQLREQAQNIE